jgi:ATP-dependent RNA helicase RhlE
MLALLPARRQNLFFSATFAPAVQGLAGAAAARAGAHGGAADTADTPRHHPARHRGGRAPAHPAAAPPGQAVHGWERALVFVATKYAAEQVADKLRRAGLSAEPFHGLLSQGKRNQVLQDFKAMNACRWWSPPTWPRAASTSRSCRWW